MQNKIETKTVDKKEVNYYDPDLTQDFMNIQIEVFKTIKELVLGNNYEDFGWPPESREDLIQKIIETDEQENSKQIRKIIIDYFYQIGLKDESGNKRDITAKEQDDIIRDVFLFLDKKIRNKEI